MTDECFDFDEIELVGNPWHGALHGTTLVTEVGVEITGAIAALNPDTHLVEFPGLPVPVTADADLALGIKWKNHAILIGDSRRYSPKSNIALARNTHVYLTEDRTHYHILVFGTNVSGSVASGAGWSLPISVVAKKPANGALGASVTLVAETNLVISGIGTGAGYYSQLSTFSPDGKKLAIAIHKFPTSLAASERDIRRSLGVAGLWEVVLSGGDSDDVPTAAMTQLRTSAECVTDSQSGGEYIDLFYAFNMVTGYSGGSQLDENGDTLPDGQTRSYGTTTHELVILPQPWGRTYTKRAIIGAAYDVGNNLKVFMAESVAVETSSLDYSGLEAGLFDWTWDAVTTLSYAVIRWINRPADIPFSYNDTLTTTTTFNLKVGETVAITNELIYSVTNTRHGPFTVTSLAGQMVGYSESSTMTRTLNGITTTALKVDAVMTSNNTACSLIDLDAFGFAAPSGEVGGAQSITLDGAGLPWAAWHPKTGELATTPGYSWC